MKSFIFYLKRQKLAQQKIFSPTKHPHGTNSLKSNELNITNNNSNLNTTLLDNNSLNTSGIKSSLNSPKNIESAFQKNFFSMQKSRPINSASNGSRMGVKTVFK
jgi:hypothetical protein